MTAWSPQPLESSEVTDKLHIPAQYRQPVVRPAAGPVQQMPTGLAMKRRNPVGVWLGLPLITFGI